MSRRELSQVSLKSDKKNGLLSWNTKFLPGLAEVIFQAVLLSMFKAVFSTKCSKKSDGEWDSSLWWPLWSWFSCFKPVVRSEGALVCGEAKNSVCLSFNIGQWSVHYWLSLLLSIPLEQIWYCWVVSGKQQRILQSEFSQSRLSCHQLCCMSSNLRLFPRAAISAACGLWRWTAASPTSLTSNK